MCGGHSSAGVPLAPSPQRRGWAGALSPSTEKALSHVQGKQPQGSHALGARAAGGENAPRGAGLWERAQGSTGCGHARLRGRTWAASWRRRPGVRGGGSAPVGPRCAGQAAVGAQRAPHLRRGLSGAGVLRCLERGPKSRGCQRLTSPRPAGLGLLPGRRGNGSGKTPGRRPRHTVSPPCQPAPVLLVRWRSPASTCLSSPGPPPAPCF